MSFNPIIQLITFIIDYFRPNNSSITPSTPNSHQTHQNQPRQVHRRRRNRHRNIRYRRIHRIISGNNHTRGSIILRARQITQQNRLIASRAEQELINAILQARAEHRFFSNQINSVPALHTQNERPARPEQRPVPEDTNTNSTGTEEV